MCIVPNTLNNTENVLLKNTAGQHEWVHDTVFLYFNSLITYRSVSLHFYRTDEGRFNKRGE